MEERRDFERHKMPVSGVVSYYAGGNELTERVDVFNLSQGGACLLHPSAIETGTIMNLEISDCDSGFADQLGVWNKVHGDMVNLRVQGQVLRNEDSSNFSHTHVAVRFNSPIKILGY